MIDKKPFRVTNEQANKIYTTSYNFRDQITGITTRELSADLLDARELIDKQEALIKEMRSDIIALAGTYRDGFIEEYCETILEKTKDYA